MAKLNSSFRLKSGQALDYWFYQQMIQDASSTLNEQILQDGWISSISGEMLIENGASYSDAIILNGIIDQAFNTQTNFEDTEDDVLDSISDDTVRVYYSRSRDIIMIIPPAYEGQILFTRKLHKPARIGQYLRSIWEVDEMLSGASLTTGTLKAMFYATVDSAIMRG